jgi:hypothetical protein
VYFIFIFLYILSCTITPNFYSSLLRLKEVVDVKFFLHSLNFTSELYFLNMQPICSSLDPLIVCFYLMVASSKFFYIIEFSKDHLIALNPYFTSALSCLKGQCHEIFDFFS